VLGRALINRGIADQNAFDVRFAPDVGSECGHRGLPRCADTVAKVVLHWWSEILRAAGATFV
jgi:hypothetical protein